MSGSYPEAHLNLAFSSLSWGRVPDRQVRAGLGLLAMELWAFSINARLALMICRANPQDPFCNTLQFGRDIRRCRPYSELVLGYKSDG